MDRTNYTISLIKKSYLHFRAGPTLTVNPSNEKGKKKYISW